MGSKSLQTVGFGRRSVIHIYKLQTLDYAFYVGSVLECTWPIPSVWIASRLATLQISKTVGDAGKEITPEIGFEDRITRYLRFFSCQCRLLSSSI